MEEEEEEKEEKEKEEEGEGGGEMMDLPVEHTCHKYFQGSCVSLHSSNSGSW